MPELRRFVKISYRTDGEARHAMRLLNEHLRKEGLKPGEAESRVLNFLDGKEHRGHGDAVSSADPSPALRLPRVIE